MSSATADPTHQTTTPAADSDEQQKRMMGLFVLNLLDPNEDQPFLYSREEVEKAVRERWGVSAEVAKGLFYWLLLHGAIKSSNEHPTAGSGPGYVSSPDSSLPN